MTQGVWRRERAQAGSESWPLAFHAQAVTSCEPPSPSHRSLVALTLEVLNPKRGPTRWGWQPHTPLGTNSKAPSLRREHQPARHQAWELLWALRAGRALGEGTQLRQSRSGAAGGDHRRGCSGPSQRSWKGIGLHPELMEGWEGC